MRRSFLLLAVLLKLGSTQPWAEEKPVVHVVATTPALPEGDRFDFIILKEGGDAAVQFELAGTAQGNIDYQSGYPNRWVILPAEISRFQITIYTTNDSISEPEESIIFRILPSQDYQVGIGTATVLLRHRGNVNTNAPPAVYLTAAPNLLEKGGLVQLSVAALDSDGIAAVWIMNDTNVLAKLAPSGTNIVTQFYRDFTWTNPPVGTSVVSAIALDRRGTAGANYIPPISIRVAEDLPRPIVAAHSSYGTITRNTNFVFYSDSLWESRGGIIEYPLSASATNDGSYFEFEARYRDGAKHPVTLEVTSYPGDGLATLEDFSRTNDILGRFTFLGNTQRFRIDVSHLTRAYAGQILGLRVQPVLTNSTQSISVRDQSLQLYGFVFDDPTVVRWLNPPNSRTLSSLQSIDWELQIHDADTPFSYVELYADNIWLGRTGQLAHGTNLVRMTTLNPVLATTTCTPTPTIGREISRGTPSGGFSSKTSSRWFNGSIHQ